MNLLEEAIKHITYKISDFPEKEFQIIRENAEEAKPYLRAAIDRAIAEKDSLEQDYELYFYALFLLGEFQDRESFGKIVELASLAPNVVDYLLGDLTTEVLPDILYNTYNGNLELLKESVRNQAMDEFVRNAMLKVMGQLYLDGTLGRKEWQDFLKEQVYTAEKEGSAFHTWLADIICTCHLIELLPDIRYLYDRGNLELNIFGGYDDFLDMMFQYDEENPFCKSPMSINQIRTWAMFQKKDTKKKDFDMYKALRDIKKELSEKPVKKLKIGRNDPCPCGSGKKYKQCCINKPQDEVQEIESAQEQQKWLKRYPETGVERQEGRIYLEDYFDDESIKIDRQLYLALKHRPIPIWESEKRNGEDARKKAYLWKAFSKYTARMEREGIESNEEYDKKYSIHYRCSEWLHALLDLLEKSGEKEAHDTVLKYCGR